MKKILLFATTAVLCMGSAYAAVRDANSATRVRTTVPEQKASPRVAIVPQANRAATQASGGAARIRASQSPAVSRSTIGRPQTSSPKPKTSVVARAATDETPAVETKTGAAYEQCKDAYFTCMDQFCKLKNDDYRRCSCSDRVYQMTDVKNVMQDAQGKLTEFTESLDAVGMSASQAGAMKIASEGENALTADGSASKALLQAIMNSIKGGDTNVGGKFSSLNTINISFDTSNAFGMTDTGQVIAAYNGKNLYGAVYPQCRNAVRADCNDASLQRAVTAYLMAVEQDCNTVQSAIDATKKKMTAAVRESGALLDLARVENRQSHNNDDMTACLNNVESAVLSEEVCGANYHKCLDNGEFIDITTGKPIAGVINFFELEKLLMFNESTNMSDQKLSKISNNRGFVQNFEKRVKKFAKPALEKCAEKADQVWTDYLDKAMLDIFYAQKTKVAEIKQGCFDFVSSCYMNADNAMTKAMTELIGDTAIVLQPDNITLNSAVCREYVASCNNMFDGDIMEKYIQEIHSTDMLTACRAVAKQCFDTFGGTSYENFYYPYSGLFSSGNAADWFTLYDTDHKYKSQCAKQLLNIQSCSKPEIIEKAFGGFDSYAEGYGLKTGNVFYNRKLRESGIATEVYHQIIDILKTQCANLQGRFVELQFVQENSYNPNNICLAEFDDGKRNNNIQSKYNSLINLYGIGYEEDMCPRGYRDMVDIKSWGACNCWENGARRSKWGKITSCEATMPTTTAPPASNIQCSAVFVLNTNMSSTQPMENWCAQGVIDSTRNQVCPFTTKQLSSDENNHYCVFTGGSTQILEKIPLGAN